MKERQESRSERAFAYWFNGGLFTPDGLTQEQKTRATPLYTAAPRSERGTLFAGLNGWMLKTYTGKEVRLSFIDNESAVAFVTALSER